MQEKAEGHMGSPHPPFPPHFLKLLMLPLVLIAASSCMYVLSSAFFTVLVMVLPTSLFFAFYKRKQLLESNPVEKPQDMAASCEPHKHAHGGGGGGGRPINGFSGGSPDPPPVSEGEAEEILLDLVDQIPAYSDSSVSDDEPPECSPDRIPASSDGLASDDESSVEDMDPAPASSASSERELSEEEGLIEIALPDGHPLWLDEPKNAVSRPHSQGFLPGFSPEMVLRQQELLELFSEMNEEDNLIEIDIAAGSVKSSILGIKA